MSNATPRRPANQPPVPLVTIETWRALLAAADAYGRLEPWTWMHDSQLLGLRDPKTGEKLLCSILGRLREIFGLLVFRHEAGHRWLLAMIVGSDDPEETTDPNRGLEQDCLKVEFTRKAELSDPDRRVPAAAGFIPSGKRGAVWPSFRSIVPGCFPWYLTQAEAEALLYVLPRVSAFAVLMRERRELNLDLLQGGVPFLAADFDPAHRPLCAEDLDWTPMFPPPAPPIEALTLDEATLIRLRELPQATGFHLELDVFYSAAVIGEGDRPYFPHAALAVDRASGVIGGCHLAPRGEGQGQSALAKVLVQTVEGLRHRPESFRVQSRRVAQMLKVVAEQLDIRVHRDRALPELNRARHELEARFRR